MGGPGRSFTLHNAIEWLMPRHCAVCRERNTPLCDDCADLLQPPPVPDPTDVGHLDAVVALFAYSGPGRRAIRSLKYDNHRDALRTWAHLLAGELDAAADGTRIDVVTWVPTSKARRLQRGYDQAELVARAIARELGSRSAETLLRLDAATQTGRSRQQRRATRLAPNRWAQTRLRGCCVAIVDDVRTTGASLDAAAAALRSSGAERVIGGTIAATPAPGESPT